MFDLRLPAARLIFLLLLLPGPSTADPSKPCTLSNNWCVPLIGCFEEGNAFFLGQTYGRREGPVVAATTGGVRCLGTWKRGMIGGSARFTCENGWSGRVTYRHLDKGSGTAVGKGRLKTGERLDFWSGHKLMRYFVQNELVQNGMMRCGEALMPAR